MKPANFLLLLFSICSFAATAQETFAYDSIAYRDTRDSISFSIYFDKNSHELTPAQKVILTDKLGIRQSGKDFEIQISGHTDGDASDDYNLALSKRRVKTIAQGFRDAGFDNSKISTDFYGESKPVANNETEEGQRLNRRVDVKLHYTYSFEYIIPCAGVKNVCHEDTMVRMPSGTLIKVNKCAYLRNPSCYNVSEFVSGEQIRDSGLHTMDEDENPLVSGGMLTFNICDSNEVTALVPRNRGVNCLTGDMNLYEIDEDGNWKLLDIAAVPIQIYGGEEYFVVPLRGVGSINLDMKITLPKRKRYTVFKAKRGIKLQTVWIQCDCPLTVLSNSDAKRKGRKIKLPKVCCPNEPMVRIASIDKNGVTRMSDYKPISQFDTAHKLGGCKQEERWRWFTFRKRNKSMFKKYRVKMKDLK